jgi:hypothetical protein
MVGYAQKDITPAMGVSMPGYFHDRKATAVLDPLLAKALVLSLGDTTVAIVALDLIGVPASVVKKLREAIQKETGIPPNNVFVHATHTHTGANVSQIQETLPPRVAAAVKEALGRRVAEERVRRGEAKESSVAFIRRFLMQDGSVRTNPGRGNPGIVRPIGEIDSRVHVLSFAAAKTLLVSFGLHLDCVGGTKFSADYPYHLTEAVRESLGRDWNVLFLNACSGNVNHINVEDKTQRSSYEESRKIGRALAKAALKAHEESEPMAVSRLAVQTKKVQCRAREIPSEVQEWAKRELEKDAEGASRRKFNELTPSRIIRLAERHGRVDPAEIMVIALGPLGIVGLPAEAFVEVGRDIQRHSPLKPTLVIGLSNGTMGYLPHPRGYREGGYEATFSSARYAAETSWLWSDTAATLLRDATR